MKIIKLTAENVKKVAAVEITPKGNVVKISGKNGQGKSSVLDAIWWAVAGASHIQAQPIRKGQERAIIRLDLGELVVERKFTEKGTTLVVESAEGARFGKPQTVLDELIGALAFDPLEFARMAPKDQRQALLKLVKLDVDPDVLDGKRARAFDERTDVNRDIVSLRARAAGVVVPEMPPLGEGRYASVAEAQAAFDALRARNDERRSRRTALARMEQAIPAAERLISDAQAKIKQLEESIAAQRGIIERTRADIDALPPIDADEDATEASKAVGAAAERMRAQMLADQKAAAEREAKEKEDRAATLTLEIEGYDKAKSAAIAAAQMPVAGLGFNADGVTMNDLPFDQASTAEQIRVSLAIAMAANPKLRVIRIKDGSMLDEDGMALVAEAAEKNDYQVWMEVVDSSGTVGVVIEDGRVKSDNQAPWDGPLDHMAKKQGLIDGEIPAQDKLV